MLVIRPRSTVTVPVEHGRNTITVRRGTDYVMHDVEVATGRQNNSFSRIDPLPEQPAVLPVGEPVSGRLVLPFIGGLGDAVSMLPLLDRMRQKAPGLTVEVSTTPGPAELFALSSLVDRIVPYPLTIGRWRAYDWFLSMEVVEATGQQPGRALPTVFGDAVGLPAAGGRFLLEAPPSQRALPDLPPAPRVGIGVGDGTSMRAYPRDRVDRLLQRLTDEGLHCVLFGHDDPNWSLPARENVLDLRSRTPHLRDLARWLTHMDHVVAHDSFIFHFAGAMGVPGTWLFAPTSHHHADVYASSSNVIFSQAACTPCHFGLTNCPLGHDRCVAWDHPDLDPDAVADGVLASLAAPAGV